MNYKSSIESGIFEIEGYQVIPSKNTVKYQGKDFALTPKMLAVLIVLAENQGQTVAKAQLMNQVWGDTFTTDMVLSRAISDLRKLFGDSAKKQSFISTISKQGYCLTKPVIWGKARSPKRALNNKYALIGMALLVALTAFVLGELYSNRLTSLPLDLSSAPRLKNITADKNDQRYARFSPDGLKLAYLEKSDNNRNLKVLVRTLANDQVVVVKEYLERPDILAVNFAFSSDGNKLALKELSSKKCTISVILISSLEENVLNDCPESPIASIDWFPNSSELLVTNYHKESGIVGLSKINIDSGKVSHFNISHNEPLGLLFPRISENGQSVLLVSIEPRADRWGVAIFDPGSGRLDFVLKSDHQINQAVWYEPGKSFFYVVDSGNQPGVWYYDLKTETSKHIHTIDRNIRDLDFNIHNSQFTYIQEEYNLDVWRISMDSNGAVTDIPLNLPSYQNSNPTLSPNEKYLALFSVGRGQHELLIYDLESQSISLRYQKDNLKFIDVSWSPDSRYLLLTTSEEENSRLYQVDIRTGSATQIRTEVGYRPYRGRWSMTNNNIYWSEQKGSLRRLVERNSNGALRYFDIDLNQEYQFILSGNVLYKEGGNFLAQNSIFKCQIDRNNCNSHLSDENEEVIVTGQYLAGWDYRNDSIFYTLFNSETLGYMLYKMPLSSKQAQPLYSLGRDALARTNQLSMSSDEKTLYYTKKQRISFDIILMEQGASSS